MTFLISLMGTRSMAMMRDCVGQYFEATCDHEPGAAQRSSTAFDFDRRSYFLFSWISLKDARERHPCSFARW